MFYVDTNCISDFSWNNPGFVDWLDECKLDQRTLGILSYRYHVGVVYDYEDLHGPDPVTGRGFNDRPSVGIAMFIVGMFVLMLALFIGIPCMWMDLHVDGAVKVTSFTGIVIAVSGILVMVIEMIAYG